MKEKLILSEVGLVKNVIIKECVTERNTIKRIAANKEITFGEVMDILRYNVISAKQLAYVTGTSVATVMAMAKPKYYHSEGIVTTKLSYCFPFPIPEEKSFKFIFRNKECEDFIKENL